MEYLHKSHLRSHGNLKSSNCLVDARWTVRVSFHVWCVVLDYLRNPEKISILVHLGFRVVIFLSQILCSM